jgi:uncharacterized protein (DUF305 family)
MKNAILSRGLLFLVIFGLSQTLSAADLKTPIIQPGAPGLPSKTLTPEVATSIANTSFSSADVIFMQEMIIHHQQALEMSILASDRTNNESVLDLAERIKVSQDDEMLFMSDWLIERSKTAPDLEHKHHHHTGHNMMGMATSDQMRELRSSKGTEFDRLYLTLMIKHHDGAVKMVEHLRDQPGSAYDASLDEFVSDVENDQAAEIERMNGLLVGLSEDPRASLAAGLFDAEHAIMNMRLLESQQKPTGFFDPNNLVNLGGESLKDKEDEEADDHPKTVVAAANARRYPLLSFSNTDMAFSEDLLVTGSYHGFNIYRLNETGRPILATSVVCPGGQGDVSLVGHLLIMSVEQSRGRVDCGLQGVGEDVSEERFRGIRIFDVSDISQPIQVGAVQTCRGSHTHSVVSGPDLDGNILVYNSGISWVREEEELEGCLDGLPGDDRTALFRIDVIEIPMKEPSKSRIIDSPTVFADPETGALAGLWRGGDHGDDTQETYRTDQCHDITVYPTAKIAAGACSGNGILFDISDPRKPTRIDAVTDEGFAYWHSATFNNDGTKVLFTDEWGGGGRARCRAWDPINWGADAIYDIDDGKLKYKSHYKMPAPQLETENCVAHNGSIIPVPGRDIFIQAWYQGGISVIDFTDSSNPIEIAYFDRGPIHETELVSGGFWSVYYYEGIIYGTEIVRGLDVLELVPSEFISANEISAAAQAYPKVGPNRLFNPQQQIPMSWPDSPELAGAYLDQLVRSNMVEEANAAELQQLLFQAGGQKTPERSKILAREIDQFEISFKANDVDDKGRAQVRQLERVLKAISSKLKA